METIQAKQRFEKKMLAWQCWCNHNKSDNRIFASLDFMDEVNRGLQNNMFSRVGAHHQNRIAERGIQSNVTKERTLLIHAGICWPDATDKSLWPMAVDYALHHHNHMP